MQDGYFVLPCRLVLPIEQRERLERLCRGREQDINAVVSDLVLAYLEALPDESLAAPLPAVVGLSLEEQVRHYERDLRRMRMRQRELGAETPAWVMSYIGDLEREIQTLHSKLKS